MFNNQRSPEGIFPVTILVVPWHIARHGFSEGAHLYDVVKKFPTFDQLHDLWPWGFKHQKVRDITVC